MGLFRSSSTAQEKAKHVSPPPRATSTKAPTSNGIAHSNTVGSRNHIHRASVPGTGVTEDPSISAARQRVISAENAEREADKALIAARKAVAEARAIVKRLEAEAAEEARLARIKQEQAARLGERAEPLGRKFSHFYIKKLVSKLWKRETRANDYVVSGPPLEPTVQLSWVHRLNAQQAARGAAYAKRIEEKNAREAVPYYERKLAEAEETARLAKERAQEARKAQKANEELQVMIRRAGGGDSASAMQLEMRKSV